MNALIIFSAVLATSQAGLIPQPFAALPYAGAYPSAYLPYATPGAIAPVAIAPAPVAPVSSQYQAQDEFGNVNYGYSNINSAKVEVGNAYGGVTGSYTYIDAYGKPQRVDYIADDLGFRVSASNLPTTKSIVPALEAPVFTGVAPEPVEDTPEVLAAKIEFQKAFDEAASRAKRSTAAIAPLNPLALGYAAAAPLPAIAPLSPLALGYAAAPLPAIAPLATPLAGPLAAPLATPLAAPLATPLATPLAAPLAAPVASAPAVREAILTKVKLNPGHAVAYRVD